MKKVQWEKIALKDVKPLSDKIRKQIVEAVERYAEHGTGDIRPVHERPGEYALRSGDWRIFYLEQGDTLYVLRVRNRKEAYRFL